MRCIARCVHLRCRRFAGLSNLEVRAVGEEVTRHRKARLSAGHDKAVTLHGNDVVARHAHLGREVCEGAELVVVGIEFEGGHGCS